MIDRVVSPSETKRAVGKYLIETFQLEFPGVDPLTVLESVSTVMRDFRVKPGASLQNDSELIRQVSFLENRCRYLIARTV